MLIFEHCSYLERSPITLGMYQDPKHFKQRFHFHPGIEIIFVHQGVGRLIVEQSIHDIKPGALLFIKPYQPHFLQMDISADQKYVRSLIKYDPNYFSEYLKAFPTLYQFHHQLCNDSAGAQVLHVTQFQHLEKFLLENYERLERHPMRNRMEDYALYLISLLRYLRPLWKTDTASKPAMLESVPAVAQMMVWINENYDKEFQLEALAQAVHLSPNHISQLFRKATGKTITEFLTDRRMKQACILLKTTGRSVQEIGEKSGWPNFNYFCHIFKKRMGMTPKQYRYH
ncbi:helix-turn-helix domain-containing protein [Paenibacillus mesophilus]|uniref:helix-turn-helix transcriptional regulator n=1 Tax=Paenibacillus mesophilus TaxID=2582849 RepID=UPI00110EB11D|nr:AraC family transcriptional regulator [Paenibacillus mesophilus]TMV50853.1 helix-turn-helix domain-containing protein [Paenibacillus mesophilus]